MINKLLEIISDKYPLKDLDAGDYALLKASGMKFFVKKYEAEGLGHVSIMTAKGFFGLMQMDTLIINPTEKDMPLLSYDRVHAMGNDTLIYELYDTFIDKSPLIETTKAKESEKNLPEHDVGKHWYDDIKLEVSLSKKGKKNDTPKFDELTLNYMKAFIKDSENALTCDADIKREKASVYVDGLLTHGGPSTDVFKKAFGDEKTAELFETVLFGTKA